MFGSYLFILRRRALNIIVLMLPLVPLAFLYLTSRPPVYESRAVLEVGTGSLSEGLLGVSQAYEEPVRRVASIADVVTSRPVVEIASGYLRDQGREPKLVTARPRRASDYIDVVATGPTPDDAAAVTNAYVIAFFEHRRLEQEAELEELEEGLVERQEDAERQLAVAAAEAGAGGSPEQAAAQESLDATSRLLQTVRLRQEIPPTGVDVLAGASSPSRPTNEISPILAMLLSLVGVFFVACGLTLLLELIRDAVRTRDEVERLTEAPVLGEVVRRGLRSDGGSTQALGASGRLLRLGLIARSGGALPPSVLVATLPGDLDDGLLAAVALADGGAASGQRALLVADIPAGSPIRLTPAGRISVDVADPRDHLSLVRLQDHDFSWCPATSSGDRQGLLDAPVPRRAIDALTSSFDIVILAPGTPGLDPSEVAYLTSALVVVCAIGRTYGRRLATFLEVIERDLGPVRGIVLTTPGPGVGSENGSRILRRRRAKRAARAERTNLEQRVPVASAGARDGGSAGRNGRPGEVDGSEAPEAVGASRRAQATGRPS